MAYRAHRPIHFVSAPFAAKSPPGEWQYIYTDRALRSDHISDRCGCFACADARISTGHVPLDPNPELSRIARLMLARAEAFDPDETVRPVRSMRWAYIRGGHLRPTLTASVVVGALLAVALSLLLVTL